MQELSTNEETEWVEHLVAEMVDGVSHMRHSPDAMHIMKESLALPCLREVFFEEQLGVSPDTASPMSLVQLLLLLLASMLLRTD